MFKKIKTIKGAKSLSKVEQKSITGGFFGFGCQPQILQCSSHRDCPPCSFGCGIPIDLGNGNIEIADICAF